MAYILGFFAADGSMIKNKRGGYYIEFSITDEIILKHIKRVTGSRHKIAVRSNRKESHKKLFRLQIGSREWFEDLSQLGFTQGKSKTLQFPVIPKLYISDLVRGYFDGDGCVYFKKLKFADRKKLRAVLMTLFTSGSLSFLQNLHGILRSKGIVGGSVKSKKRGFELTFSHKDSLALYHFLYNTVPATDLYLPRKYRLFKKAIRVLYPDAVVA